MEKRRHHRWKRVLLPKQGKDHSTVVAGWRCSSCEWVSYAAQPPHRGCVGQPARVA